MSPQQKQANKDLQTALNQKILASGGTPLVVDGIIGKLTNDALAQYNTNTPVNSGIITPNGVTVGGFADVTKIPNIYNNGVLQKTTSVNSYIDNQNGTTTNTPADGSQDNGTYVKNADGTYNFVLLNGTGNPTNNTSPKDNLSSDITRINAEKQAIEKELNGIGDARNTELTSTGVYDKLKQLNALDETLNKLKYRDELRSTGATTRDDSASYTSSRLEKNAIQALTLSSQINTQLAITNQKFDEIKETKKFNLEQKTNYLGTLQTAYADILTREQATALEERKQQNALEIKNLDFNNDMMKSVYSDAVKGGANPTALNGIANSKTYQEAIELASPYLKSITTDVVKLDNGNTVLVNNQTGNIIKNLGGAKAPDSDNTTSGIFSSLVNTVSSLENTVAGKQSVQNQMNNYIKNQDYSSAYNQVANTVAQGLPAQIKERFENARVDREILSNFRVSLQDYVNAGGNVGFLTGTAENIKRRLLGVTGDPELTKVAVQLEREFQAYRNAMTGAAFTPEESKEYAAVNPTANKSLDLNLAVIDGALDQLTNRVDGTIKAKVPQATDLLKLVQVPVDSKQAKDQVDSLYLNNPTAQPYIQKLLAQNLSDSDILEYLKTKKIIK